MYNMIIFCIGTSIRNSYIKNNDRKCVRNLYIIFVSAIRLLPFKVLSTTLMVFITFSTIGKLSCLESELN